MKTIKLMAALLLFTTLAFSQEAKDSTVTEKPKIEINYDMIMRFHLADFDSTQNFNYMLSRHLESYKKEDE